MPGGLYLMVVIISGLVRSGPEVPCHVAGGQPQILHVEHQERDNSTPALQTRFLRLVWRAFSGWIQVIAILAVDASWPSSAHLPASLPTLKSRSAWMEVKFRAGKQGSQPGPDAFNSTCIQLIAMHIF